MELRTEGFIVGQTTFKVASNKIAKHENVCSDNQYVFIPFIFYNFDFLTQKIIDLFPKIQRLVHSNVISLIAFRKINCVI